MLDRLPIASFQLAVLALLLLALGRLPGKWRAWGWRLALIKGAVLILGAIALPLLASEVAPGIPETPYFPMDGATPAPSGTIAMPPVEGVNWILWGWLSGTVLVLARLGWRVGKKIHDLEPVPSVWAATESGGVPIRVSRSVAAPMIVGIFRPCIVLPAWEIPPVGWEAAIAHERAHARRRDLLWDALVQGLAALFWFHPAAWLAVREHRLACEEACDAEAIRVTGGSSRDYALTLVQLGRPTSAGLALGAPARALRRRIHAMHRRTPSARWALPFLVFAGFLAVPLELTAAPLDQASIPVSSFDQVASGMIARPSVRKELGITDEVLRRANAASEEKLSQIKVLADKLADMKNRGVPDRERIEYERKAKARYFNENASAILAHLTPPQVKRLREIALQRCGPLALVVPEIARAAGVSDRTARTIIKLKEEFYRETSRHSQAEFRKWRDQERAGFGLTPAEQRRRKELESGPMDQVKQAEYQKLRAKIEKAMGLPRDNPYIEFERDAWARYSAQAEAALSPSDRRGWKKLQGKPLPAVPSEAHLY
jgi:hypothetical protein